MASNDALAPFWAPTREWFLGAFKEATPAQEGAWKAISQGENTLVVAPTGSGKTLSAFLWALDRTFRRNDPELFELDPPAKPHSKKERTGILYISPLKALGMDVERNLRSPLVGISQAAERLGLQTPEITVGVRTGDTTASERQKLVRNPPDILITTPESLYLMLTSKASETLHGVHTVIIDEVHALAGNKRGAHLALSLERLDEMLPKPAQRIGLSATVRPISDVAEFLGGSRPVEIVAPKTSKTFDLSVIVPVPDMEDVSQQHPGTMDVHAGTDSGPGNWENPERAKSIWPHVEEAIVAKVLAHRSTIVFANSRRLAERLTARLNEIYAESLGYEVEAKGGAATQLLDAATGPDADIQPPILAKAHHGSVSKEQRAIVEDELKSGALRCVVATSSLELGIDMGAVDLVIQVETPPSAASGLQRVGRAGHQVGEVSRAAFFPKHRTDLLRSAAVSERMLSGNIEAVQMIQNPLDILAQQTVAATVLEPLDVERWFDTVRRSSPFKQLPRSAFEATLDLISGKYPSAEFSELRPRVVWDRDAGVLTARPGTAHIAVTSGGTIPDRGLFGVFIAGATSAARVGELDEEMVYESRVGDVFTLGTTSWKIVEITPQRVNVVPAFDQAGKVPFWHGDGPGRPYELGKAIGQFTREISRGGPRAEERLIAAGLEPDARENLFRLLRDQQQATGQLPSDRTLVLERSKDEVGDWQLLLHSPFGARVNSPWALAISARLREQIGVDALAHASDDGIVVRLPETDSAPPGAELFLFDAAEIEAIVTEEIAGSALFGARFREASARSLLMPRRDPSKRTPLWQQRQRASQLLQVARKFPNFPVIMETIREVLQDVYELPALREVLGRLDSRDLKLVEVTTSEPSPFARDLLFGYVASSIYLGDSPLAERRAAALGVDPAMLRELLGQAEMRQLLDAEVIARFSADAARLSAHRMHQGAEGVADLLRVLGPLTVEEVARRLRVSGFDYEGPDAAEAPLAHLPHASEQEALSLLFDLQAQKRVLCLVVAGREFWCAVEDAALLRDALGAALPVGVPEAFLGVVADPLPELLARFARHSGPFATSIFSDRFGLASAVVERALRGLLEQGRLSHGYFLPEELYPPDYDPDAGEWVDVDVLRLLRSRSLAIARGNIQPVSQDAFARFLPKWQGVLLASDQPADGDLSGVDGVMSVVEQLAGVPIPASAWESLVLPARVRDYQLGWLDSLMLAGEVVWWGRGAIGAQDGWLSLYPQDLAQLLLAPERPEAMPGSLDAQILAVLGDGGAYFVSQLAERTGASAEAVTEVLWRLAWAGVVRGDTFVPVRALLGSGLSAHRAPKQRARARTAKSRHSTRALLDQFGSAFAVSDSVAGGRWSLVSAGFSFEDSDRAAQLRAATNVGVMLDRYGVLTRGSVVEERSPGGFAQAYRFLAQLERDGHARRGYIVDGLGGAQFATSATVDLLRSFVSVLDAAPLVAVTLAATDPANAYGGALPWPALPEVGHRPGRKAGALVVLVDGDLVLYLERGGKTVLLFKDDSFVLSAAAKSLLATSQRGDLGQVTIEKVNGEFVYNSPLALALREAGFRESVRGFTLPSRRP